MLVNLCPITLDNNEAILKQYSWSNFNLRRDMLKYFPHVTLAVGDMDIVQ